MKFPSHSARRLALLAPVALLFVAGCSNTPLGRSTAEFVSPATWVDNGHNIARPLASNTNSAPFYPTAMLEEGVEGLVSVDCVVDATGHVLLANVVTSTHRAFNQPTLDAVRGWTFEPATRDGVAVSMAVRLPVTYVIAP